MNAYKYIDENKNHLHTLDGKPLMGASTVAGIISKPLTYWASGMAVGTLGWKNIKKVSKLEKLESAENALEMIKELDVNAYSDLLDKAYVAFNEKKDLAAEAGTDMHALLENYVTTCIKENGGIPLAHKVNESKEVSSFVEWSMKNVKRFLASEIHTFSRTYWLGGICDVIYEDLKGDVYIGDFKSSKEAYFSQFVQASLYHIQITENNGGYDKDGNKILELESPVKGYTIFPFGSDFKEPTVRYVSEAWLQTAVGACALYSLQNQTS